MLDRNDLVMAGASIGNPDFELLLQACIAGGFRGLSVNPSVYFAAKEKGLKDIEMRSMLVDHGVEINDIGAILLSMGPDSDNRLVKTNEEEIFQVAEALEIDRSSLVFLGEAELTEDNEDEIERYAEVFSRTAEQAFSRGLKTYIEFVPSMSSVKSSRAAKKIIETAGRADTGLLVDTWHCHVGTTSSEDLMDLPGALILGVQLCGIPNKPPGQLLKLGLHERMAPGFGCFDLVGFIRMLDELGCNEPLAVEVFSDVLSARYSSNELSRYLGDSMRAVVAQARFK